MIISRYNEKEYAEKIWNDGFQTSNRKYELELLTKLFSSMGHAKKEVERELIDFCETHESNFSYTSGYSKIDRAIRTSYNKNFVELKEIPITYGELLSIDELGLDDIKSKILLSMIFKIKQLSLLKNIPYDDVIWFFYGTNKKYRELKRISKVPKRQNVNVHIHNMIQMGILEAYLGGSLALSFLKENDNLKNQETYFDLSIINYSEVGRVWEKYKGSHRICSCSNCKKLIRKNAPSQKYCKECAVIINREKTRMSLSKKRTSD